MTDHNRIRAHSELVDRMASTLGLDLEEKVLEAMLDMDTLTDAVLRCTGCSDPAGCAHWLDEQDGKATHTPHMCRNSKMFRMLKGGKRV